METFDIYKTNFIKARLKYMNAKEKFLQYNEFNSSEPTPAEKALFERYETEKWERFINVTHAADMMGDYVAKCAMARIEDKDLTCLISGENLENECFDTFFEFTYNFLPMPTIERLADMAPALSELLDRIYFGTVNADEAKKKLEEEGVKCGEITTISGFREIDILRPPFEELVDEIADLAMAAIDGFRSESRS